MKIDSKLVAIVTGGASGLGEATVRTLRAKGAKVVIADINVKSGEAIAKELGKDTLFIKTDVTHEQEIKALITKTVSTFGRISVVLNSAGVFYYNLFATEKEVIPTWDIQNTFNVNVIGTMNVCKYAAQQMIKQEAIDGQRGVLINISSTGAVEGRIGWTVYSATKGAIDALTLPMARDLGKYGIRVMAVAPGMFETPMTAVLSKQFHEEMGKMVSLGRNGKPFEFAALACSIIENSFASGQTWRLDGGVRTGP